MLHLHLLHMLLLLLMLLLLELLLMLELLLEVLRRMLGVCVHLLLLLRWRRLEPRMRLGLLLWRRRRL